MVGRKKFSPVTIFSYIFFIVFAIVTIYPLWSIMVGSLTPYHDFVRMTFKLFPRNITLEAYSVFFRQEAFLVPFRNSLIYTVGGGVLSIIITTMAAYALSRKKLPGRKIIMGMFFFTMLFNGGIIPLFITMQGYGIADTLWAVIFADLVDIVFLIIMRAHFQRIPSSLEESAYLDGAGDIQIFTRIMVPLSKPTIATITLFYLVNKWSDFFNPLFLIRTPSRQVLQVTLYNIIFSGSMNTMTNSFTPIASANTTTESLRMAAIVAVTLPILIVYPFLQKHFAKGIVMGAVKE